MMSKVVEEACVDVAHALKKLIAAVRDTNGREERGADFCRPNGDKPPLRAAAPSRELPQDTYNSADDKASACVAGRIFVYVAGSRGLADLARRHGSSINAALGLTGREPYIAKIGTTTVPLEVRLQQIGADRYGAAVRRGDQLVIEPGFERWVAQTIMPTRPPCDPSITLLPRAIAVDLPVSLSRRAFDKGLQEALARRALDQLPASIVPARYVAYDLVQTRVSEACELYALFPQNARDCDLLLEAVESILERHRSSGRSKDHSPARPAIPVRPRSNSGRKARTQQAAALAAGVDYQLTSNLGTRVRPFSYSSHRGSRS